MEILFIEDNILVDKKEEIIGVSLLKEPLLNFILKLYLNKNIDFKRFLSQKLEDKFKSLMKFETNRFLKFLKMKNKVNEAYFRYLARFVIFCESYLIYFQSENDMDENSDKIEFLQIFFENLAKIKENFTQKESNKFNKLVRLILIENNFEESKEEFLICKNDFDQSKSPMNIENNVYLKFQEEFLNNNIISNVFFNDDFYLLLFNL